MKRSIFLYAFLFYSNLLISQTTTFDYLNSNLSTIACNVFNPSVNLNSVIHSSRAGGVNFSTTNGLGLPTTPNVSPQRGTAFVIGYIYSTGSKYTISIVARGKQELILGACVVPDLNQFQTNGSTSCTTDPNVSGYTPQGIGRLEVATTTTNFATYNISQFEPTTTFGNLIIWARGGAPSLSLDVLNISTITITKTPNANFTLSPSSSNLNCGSTTPLTGVSL